MKMMLKEVLEYSNKVVKKLSMRYRVIFLGFIVTQVWDFCGVDTLSSHLIF